MPWLQDPKSAILTASPACCAGKLNPRSETLGKNAESWTALTRAGYDLYRDVLNTPAFLAFLPDVVGLTGLDISCDEAGNARFLAKKGAKMCGLDFAPTFISHARAAEQQTTLNIEVHHADCKNLLFAHASFDFAVTFMSLMDVDDTDRALGEVHWILTPG
jgi:ubiquinone/menaquinone biosynthesis C-methylase UbiE